MKKYLFKKENPDILDKILHENKYILKLQNFKKWNFSLYAITCRKSTENYFVFNMFKKIFQKII